MDYNLLIGTSMIGRLKQNHLLIYLIRNWKLTKLEEQPKKLSNQIKRRRRRKEANTIVSKEVVRAMIHQMIWVTLQTHQTWVSVILIHNQTVQKQKQMNNQKKNRRMKMKIRMKMKKIGLMMISRMIKTNGKMLIIMDLILWMNLRLQREWHSLHKEMK